MRFAATLGWLAIIALVAIAVVWWPGQRVQPYEVEVLGNLLHLSQDGRREIYVRRSAVNSFIRWDRHPEQGKPALEIQTGAKIYRLDAVDRDDAERLERFFVDALEG